MAEPDVNNFSSSSPHRLPTQSASSLLPSHGVSSRQAISTGLNTLDVLLSGELPRRDNAQASASGILQGQVTEVYGPPGSGKTSLAIQMATNALKVGNTVAWVGADTSYALDISRLKENALFGHNVTDDLSRQLSDLHHLFAPSLPFLLAILCQPSASFPPAGCSLLVIDSLSGVFNASFPKTKDQFEKGRDQKPAEESHHWTSKRRWTILEELASRLQKLAVINNMVILIINQTTTWLRHESGVLLQSALSGQAFDSCVKNRIATHRDWFNNCDMDAKQDDPVGMDPSYACGAVVTKANGNRPGTPTTVVLFRVTKEGVKEINTAWPMFQPGMELSNIPTSSTDHQGEVADSQSDGDGYGSDEGFELDVPTVFHTTVPQSS